MDRRKIVVLHIRGYTDNPEKAIETTQLKMPIVKNLYTQHSIIFRELVWPEGVSKISVFSAASIAAHKIDEYREYQPDTLVILSGHSLGAVVALLAASIEPPDGLVLEEPPIGGTYDFVLRLGKFDLKNQAVISGLRKNSPAITELNEHLLRFGYKWPPTLEIKGWFGILGQLLFGSFPNTGFGKVIRIPWMNHHQVWEHPKAIARIAKFAHSLED